MADTNHDARPPVLVETNLTWPGINGHEDTEYEIPRTEWDAMSPAERTQRCEALALADAVNRFGWGWNIADADDYASTEEQK